MGCRRGAHQAAISRLPHQAWSNGARTTARLVLKRAGRMTRLLVTGTARTTDVRARGLGWGRELPGCGRPLWLDALPAMRAQRAEAAAALTRAVAQLRPHPPVRDAAGHRPARLRPGRDAFR